MFLIHRLNVKLTSDGTLFPETALVPSELKVLLFEALELPQGQEEGHL